LWPKVSDAPKIPLGAPSAPIEAAKPLRRVLEALISSDLIGDVFSGFDGRVKTWAVRSGAARDAFHQRVVVGVEEKRDGISLEPQPVHHAVKV